MIAPISELLEDLCAGRMVIIVDDENRENEGDLLMAAQHVRGEDINFMITHARGLVCLPITSARAKALSLPLMSKKNESRFHTAFTVSIEARHGVTTGISAFDRAHTIKTAIDETQDPSSIVTPGHIFPIIAKDGGVLERAGHTEATIDLMRLAGLYPAGVICEILAEDGQMSRLPNLKIFAQTHNLKIGTIADLIAHRKK